MKMSLLKLSKSLYPLITSSVIKSIFNKIALFLGDIGFTYRVNKERRDSSVKDLQRLVELQSKRIEFQS